MLFRMTCGPRCSHYQPPDHTGPFCPNPGYHQPVTRDVVYMLKPADAFNFEELRYSLRSLVNLPHGKVWIVGGYPSWLSENVHHQYVRQLGLNKFAGAGRTFTAAGGLPTTDQFYLFHDDMYVMSPVPEVPRLYRSTWSEWVSGRGTAHSTRWALQTERLMKRLEVPLVFSYEVHVPMLIDRQKFRHFINRVREVSDGAHPQTVMGSVCKRSAYGNFVGYGGVHVRVDPKLRAGRDVSMNGFVSSSGDRVPQAVRDAFPDPSPYEKGGPSHFYPLNA